MPDVTTSPVTSPQSIAGQLGLSIPGDETGNILALTKRAVKLQEEESKKITPMLEAQERAVEKGERESEEAFKKIEPFKPLPPPDQRQYQSNPLDTFFSLGSVFGILASAFTHSPWQNSFAASAAAIDARNKGDADAFAHALDEWKTNTNMMIERHKIQMDDWRAIHDKTKDDMAARDGLIRAYQAKYGDEQMAALREAGMFKEVEELQDRRNQAILGIEEAAPKIIAGATATEGLLKLRAANALPDTDPQKQKKITEAHQAITDGMMLTSKASGVIDMGSVQETAKLIAHYQMAPLSAFALRSPWGQAVMAMVGELNPDYSGPKYAEVSKAVQAFGPGKQGDQVRAINVAIQHIAVGREMARALENGDIQTFNRLGQAYAEETGNPVPTNFDAVKNILGEEITKAVVTGGGGAKERERAGEAWKRAASPEQLSQAFDSVEKLMAGQMVGLRKQYENATGLKDFDDKLLPATIDALARIQPGKEAATGGSSYEVPDSLRDIPNLKHSKSTGQYLDPATGTIYDASGNKVQ